MEVKAFLVEEFIDKPVKIKTEGKSDRCVAREVEASNIAAKKLALALRKFERDVKVTVVESKPFI